MNTEGRGILPYLVPVAVLSVLRVILPIYIFDDAYISFRMACNLGDGNGMVFNYAERIYVTTAPLWVLLLAGARLLVHDVVLAAMILGVIFDVLLLILMVKFGGVVTGNKTTSMVAALLLCTNPVFLFTGFSGMETSFYLFVILLSMHQLARSKFATGATVAAAAIWVRFDGILLYAISLLWSFYHQWSEIKLYPIRTIRSYLPSIVIVVGYFTFGYLVFDEPIPTSVQRKALTAPPALSPQWVEGAVTVIKEFILAIFGRNYSYVADTPSWVLVLPLVIGVYRGIRERQASLIPIVAFTLVYALSFILSGSVYTRVFPWYFVPILPAVCLIAASGLEWMVAATIKLSSRPMRFNTYGVSGLLFAAVWTVLMLAGPIQEDAKALSIRASETEQVYGAMAVWAGRHLPKGAMVAAHDIGAIGFFSPPDIAILDTFGLLRYSREIGVSFVELVKRDRPEMVFTKHYEKTLIEEQLEQAYSWYRFKAYDIGLRRDLAPEFAPLLAELPGIYERLNIKEEYSWGGSPEAK